MYNLQEFCSQRQKTENKQSDAYMKRKFHIFSWQGIYSDNWKHFFKAISYCHDSVLNNALKYHLLFLEYKCYFMSIKFDKI